jgi:hypothetical protein
LGNPRRSGGLDHLVPTLLDVAGGQPCLDVAVDARGGPEVVQERVALRDLPEVVVEVRLHPIGVGRVLPLGLRFCRCDGDRLLSYS